MPFSTPFTTRPEIQGTFGVVTSTHWLASATGMNILEKGGNAFDAAVAMGLALQVVEPHLNGPAGEVPMLIYSSKHQKLSAVCGQGVAPAAATIDRFRSLDLEMIPGTGLLAACVPGAFDAWMLVLRDFGTMRLADVMAPAIAFAKNGYPLVAHISNTIEAVEQLFRTEWPTSAAIYLKNGSIPLPGTLFRNEVLAGSYKRILREAETAGSDRDAQIDAARRTFYTGFVAESIDRFFATQQVMDTSERRHKGLLTGDDMARWQASLDEPLTYDYGRYTVAKPGPWSQGPVYLQQLALLKGFDLAAMDPLGPDFIHTCVECAKLAYADREAYYGDPNFVDVPIEQLLSDDYNDARRQLVNERASFELRPGRIPGYAAHVPTPQGSTATAEAAGAGEPTMATGYVAGDTCHLDVIDREGNMVSATPSGGWLQSSPVIPELGFALGTRAQMFWLEPGLPGSLEPGKRPRTTLSPSFAFRDGEPYMPFGTPGGDGQDQWTLTFFLRHVHHGMNLQQAIDAPNFQTNHFPSSFYPRAAHPGSVTVEGRINRKTVEELKRRGHKVEIGDDWSQGRMTAAAKDGEILKVAANPRLMQGYAIGR